MPELGNCPNCNAQLKTGTFSVNQLVDEHKVKAINVFTTNKSVGFCDKCSSTLLGAAKISRDNAISTCKKQIGEDLIFIPVITLQQPHNWEYTVLKLVTAQSVTGEGALTEFTSSFAELFGTQSNRMGNKLKNGENICIAQLRMEVVRRGGNAVIATDIDFAEVGGTKGMLMVCMSGTAVKLHNVEILSGDMKTVFSRIEENINKLKTYEKYMDI